MFSRSQTWAKLQESFEERSSYSTSFSSYVVVRACDALLELRGCWRGKTRTATFVCVCVDQPSLSFPHAGCRGRYVGCGSLHGAVHGVVRAVRRAPVSHGPVAHDHRGIAARRHRDHGTRPHLLQPQAPSPHGTPSHDPRPHAMACEKTHVFESDSDWSD